MMFIIRTTGEAPSAANIAVKLSRKTPAIVTGGEGKTDYFCVAEPDTIEALRGQNVPVVAVHDGYYEDGKGGGVGIWGQGKFWEIRDTPFTVKEAVGATAPATNAPQGDSEQVNVRGAIFGV
ncbi:MAG: hypothetical protein JO001_24885 [Alphaproteobacteria bacterium]|nr:hypothetical protein [Alphaproteobacteria bacterium]